MEYEGDRSMKKFSEDISIEPGRGQWQWQPIALMPLFLYTVGYSIVPCGQNSTQVGEDSEKLVQTNECFSSDGQHWQSLPDCDPETQGGAPPQLFRGRILCRDKTYLGSFWKEGTPRTPVFDPLFSQRNSPDNIQE